MVKVRVARTVAVIAVLTWSGLTARASEPMTFEINSIGAANGICGKSCVEVISAKGEITNETADDFMTFLAGHINEQELRPVVFLKSPGGAVSGAMRLGKVFRTMGAAVVVAEVIPAIGRVGFIPSRCMSACAYAFFGGKKRVIPPLSELGIHRMVIDRSGRDPAGGTMLNREFGSNDIVSTLSEYTSTMGIDPAVIRYAEQVAPETIHIVTPKEIALWRLASSHF